MRIFNTPVRINGTILIIVATLWAGVTWAGLRWHPGRNLWQAALIGFVEAILLLWADFGHALAHIFSARYAGAPMDEIVISAMDMPRTLYSNNQVAPTAHRMRAMGGPIFNLIGLLLSLAVYGISPSESIIRELAYWSSLGHGLLFVMSLVPLPIVDGGTILKWTLVVNGRTETEADEIVRRIDWVLGIILALSGVVLLALKLWAAGVILVFMGVIVIATGSGKIR